jgi:hypothetical protein
VNTTTTGAGPERRGAGFWVSAGIGWAVIGWALWQIARHRVDARPAQLARFVVGGIAVHDLLVVPVTLAAAALVRRVAPRPARRWVQAALFAAAVVAAFAYPLVRGFAHRLGNPTSLPRNYTASLLVVIAVTWAVLAVVALGRAGRARWTRGRIDR